MSRQPRPRNPSKARVRFERRGTLDVAIKDFSSRPLWLRLLVGRPSLRREARVYERLSGVRGVPLCHGLEGGDTLVLERVDAHAVDAEIVRRLGPELFERASRLLGQIHERGVAISDLHRSNLLAAADGEVYIVDFALARIARDPARPGPIVRQLMRLDRHALARIRARCLGEPEPELGGWFGALYRSGRRIKALLP